MSILALLAVVPLGQILERIPRAEQEPPRAFAEGVRLPGKPPPEARSLQGKWQFGYEVEDAPLAEGNASLIVSLAVQFEEDGRYRLTYDARWGNPPGRGKDARGITIDEIGTYKLSGDVLLLDPTESMRADLTKNKVVAREPVHNEKHVFVVHWESRRIHLAGRCARFQVDPICQEYDVENVWYTLRGSAAKRFLAR
jgi:hypothetical protein